MYKGSLVNRLCPASVRYPGIYGLHPAIDMGWCDGASRMAYQLLSDWYGQVCCRNLDLHCAGRIPADYHIPALMVSPVVPW